jgi:hydrogenase maturation factor
MPSSPKVQKELILKTAMELLIREGYAAINIKTVANELGCSTQPISRQFGSMDGFRKELLTYCISQMKQLFCVSGDCVSEIVLEIAKGYGVSAMHQITSGGILAALWELAEASKVGLEVDLKKMTIRQETVEICEFCHLNPYQLTSAGSVLLVVERGEELVQKYTELGIQASLLGKTTVDTARVILGGEEKRFLDKPRMDELLKIYDEN